MSRYSESCRCGQPSDFVCSERRVGPPIKNAVTGIIEKQPYVTYYLCAACTRSEVVGLTPPRKVEALPHHARALKRERDEAAKSLIGEIEEVRLGDWGKAS